MRITAKELSFTYNKKSAFKADALKGVTLDIPEGEFFGVVRLPDGSEVLRFTPVNYDELPEDARSRVVREIPIWKQGNESE